MDVRAIVGFLLFGEYWLYCLFICVGFLVSRCLGTDDGEFLEVFGSVGG